MRNYTPDAHRATFRGVASFLLSAACLLAPAAAWGLNSDLVVVKSGPATVNAGNNITYTIQVTNNGPDPALNAGMSDGVPAGTTFVSAVTDPTYACTLPPVGGTGAITCGNGSMAVNAVANFTVVVHVPASTLPGTSIGNVASVGSGNTDPAPGNENSAVFTNVVAAPDLVIIKNGPPTVTAGQNITYALTISNAGVSDAHTVSLFDPLPAGTTFVSEAQNLGPAFACTNPAVGATGSVSCTIATLAAGATAAFTVTLQVDPNAPNGFVLTNTALAFTADTDTNNASNSSSTNATVQTFADLRAIKAAPATATAGQNITFNLTILNNGPSNSQSAILTDPLPAGTTFQSLTQTSGPVFGCTVPAVGGTGTVTCGVATLPVGGSATFDLVVAVDTSVPAGAILGNAANASSLGTTDTNPANDTEFTSTTVGTSANLGVNKTGPASVVAGSDITYSITTGNGGPSDAVNFTMADAIPAGTTFVSGSQSVGPPFSCTFPAVGGTGTMSCSIASLPVGQFGVFSLVVNVPAGVAGGTVVSNTATAASAASDPVPGDNSSTVLTTVATSADLQVFKSGPASIAAGTNITYTLTLFNAGSSNALSVNLSDTLPANTTFVSYTQNTGPSFSLSTPAVGGTGTVTATLASLPAGGSATFTLVLAVAPAAANGSSISNTATASTTTTDPVPGNNSATSTASVVASADVTMTKTGPATIDAGSNITYTLTVNNAGPSDAQAVSISDVLPANTTFISYAQTAGPAFTLATPAVGGTGTVTSTLATLPSGASGTFTLVLKVAATAASGSSIANTATVSSTTTDPTPGNNSATATATVTTSADLQATKTGPVSAPTSSVLTYNLSLLNAGPSDALTVTFADTLPAGTTFVSFTQNTGPAFTCTTPAVGATGTVSCTMPSLAASAGGMFTLVLQALPSLLGGSVVTNTATATSATTDPTPGNNAATAVTNITAITGFSGPSATGSGTVTATFTGGGPACAFASARLIPVSGDPDSPKKTLPGVTFPHGLFEFTTTNCTPGSTLTFTITYPSSVERMRYWKFGPEPGTPKPHWYILPATFTLQVATFSITDGQQGDDDLLANGTIVDQGGPGFGGPSVPTLSEWMQWLLAALLLAMGMEAMRRRRRA